MQRSLFTSFSVKGHWWLSDHPEKSFGGSLNFTSSLIELEIQGMLGDEERYDFLKGPFTIHGKDENGKRWSLLKCFERYFVGGGSESSTIIANELLLGQHVSSLNQVLTDRISLDFPGLGASFASSGINTHIERESASVTWTHPPDLNIRLNKLSASLSSHFFPTVSSEFDRGSIKGNARLQWKLDEERPFPEVAYLIYELRNLLTMLHGMPCPVLSIEIFNSSRVPSSTVELFTLQSCSSSFPTNPIWHHMLVPLTKLRKEQCVEAVFNNWFELPENTKLAIDWFSGFTLLPTPYCQIDFVNLVQALESLHRALFDGEYLSNEDWKPIYQSIVKAVPEHLNKDQRNSLSTSIKYGNKLSQKSRLMELDLPPD